VFERACLCLVFTVFNWYQRKDVNHILEFFLNHGIHENYIDNPIYPDLR
jgi:hypothetical protein